MNRTSLIAGLLIASTLPLTAAAQSRRANDREVRIDTTFAFDRRGTVVVSAGDGEIIITAWDEPRVRVRARGDRSALRMDATTSRLTLDVARHRGDDVYFEVTVPVGARVSARATDGDVSVTGTKAAVDASTQSGDLTVADAAEVVDLRTYSGDLSARNLSGNIEINTLNGDLEISGVRGDLEATSVSGDIDMRGIAARYVRAKTTSGDVIFEGMVDSIGRYELSSHSGSVSLVVPQNTGAVLTVGTYTGTIDSDFPITLKPGEQGFGSRRFTFEIGRGEARISAESFSGDIAIRSQSSPGTSR